MAHRTQQWLTCDRCGFVEERPPKDKPCRWTQVGRQREAFAVGSMKVLDLCPHCSNAFQTWYVQKLPEQTERD